MLEPIATVCYRKLEIHAQLEKQIFYPTAWSKRASAWRRAARAAATKVDAALVPRLQSPRRGEEPLDADAGSPGAEPWRWCHGTRGAEAARLAWGLPSGAGAVCYGRKSRRSFIIDLSVV